MSSQTLSDPVIDEIRAVRSRISARFELIPEQLVRYYLDLQKRHADRRIGDARMPLPRTRPLLEFRAVGWMISRVPVGNRSPLIHGRRPPGSTRRSWVTEEVTRRRSRSTGTRGIPRGTECPRRMCDSQSGRRSLMAVDAGGADVRTEDVGGEHSRDREG